MSKKPQAGAAEKPEKAPKPKKEKIPKKPKMSLDINPVAAAMFEIQRKEATGNVLSGGVLILLGAVAILVSIVKYTDNMKKITVDEEKIFAYAWIVIAVTGIILCVIGVYEILKSFISMDQINEWTKNAESRTSPFQGKHSKRTAAEMNQSQSTEPAPVKGMAEDGSQAKKHFAWLGKKKEKKPDSTEVYNKYNPPAKKVEAPPKAQPVQKQKFDYGLNEDKKQTFADKFLAENKEDPFAKYREELGIEEEKPKEEAQKPQFIRNVEPAKAGSTAQAPAQAVPNISAAQVEMVGSLFERLAASQNIDLQGNNGGIFGSADPAPANNGADMKQQLDQMQQQLEQVAQAQQQMAEMRREVEEVKEQVEQYKPQTASADEGFYQNTKQPVAAQEKAVQQTAFNTASQNTDNIRNTVPGARMNSTVPMPTVRPPRVPDQPVSPTVHPPKIPDQPVSPTVHPPKIPAQPVSPTVNPPKVPDKPVSPTIKPPPIPKQGENQAMQQPPAETGYQPMRPIAYQPMQPVQNMYAPLPNLPGMMPNQGYGGGYVNSPFGFAGMFVDANDNRYNPAMPPYTVHPFRPAGVASPQMPQEPAYNSQMPPYTVHPFRPSGVAAPQMPQEPAYNSQMPPYTVHPFKPSGADIAAPQMEGASEESYNSAMPPYTVHPMKSVFDTSEKSSSEEESSYNSQMPPYTVHPMKSMFDTSAQPSSEEESSYNSQMPPYTVHPFKAKDPTQQPLQPQLYDPEKDKAPAAVPEIPAPGEKPAASEAAPAPSADYEGSMFFERPASQSAAPAQKPEPKPGQTFTPPAPAPAPAAPESAQTPAAPEPPAEPQKTERQKRGPMTLRGFTQRGQSDKSAKKPPITQRLGGYTFSLFEDLSGNGDRPPKTFSPRIKKNEDKKANENKKDNNGGKDMAFNMNGNGREPEKKKSFSERFLNRNGKKATEVQSAPAGGNANAPIVQNGTPAQRKFVDAADYDEWVCPGCGSTNQEYVGVCSCGERKPRTKW